MHTPALATTNTQYSVHLQDQARVTMATPVLGGARAVAFEDTISAPLEVRREWSSRPPHRQDTLPTPITDARLF